MRESAPQFVMTSHDSAKYPKTKTLPCKLESVGLGGFYFLLSQHEAKTFARIRTSCGILFFRLPRKFYEFSRNDEIITNRSPTRHTECSEVSKKINPRASATK